MLLNWVVITNGFRWCGCLWENNLVGFFSDAQQIIALVFAVVQGDGKASVGLRVQRVHRLTIHTIQFHRRTNASAAYFKAFTCENQRRLSNGRLNPHGLRVIYQYLIKGLVEFDKFFIPIKINHVYFIAGNANFTSFSIGRKPIVNFFLIHTMKGNA